MTTPPCEFCAYYAELEAAEATPDTPAPRPLTEITADAMRAECGHCWPRPGDPCDCAPGIHLARYARARRRGVLSDADMCVVLDAAGDVFEPATVIHADVAVPA